MKIYIYHDVRRDGYTIREAGSNIDIKKDHFISQIYLDDNPRFNQFFLAMYNREIIEDGNDALSTASNPNIKEKEVTLSEFNDLKNLMA